MRTGVLSFPAIAGLVCALVVTAACGSSPANIAPQVTSKAETALSDPAQTSTAPMADESPQPAPAETPSTSGGVLSIPVRQAVQVPDDIPAHMAWEGLGAGSSAEGCLDIRSLAGPADPAPVVVLPTGIVVWCYCHLTEPDGQSVSASLVYPDASIVPVETQVESIDDVLCAQYWYTFPKAPPHEVFTFTETLSGHDIVDRFVPIVGQVTFQGWQPQEPVRLVVYAADPSDDSGNKGFVADRRTTADDEGVVTVQLTDPDGRVPVAAIFAIGQVSGCQTYDHGLYLLGGGMARGCTTGDPGALAPGGAMAFVTWSYDAPGPAYEWEPCSDAPASHLRAGIRAVVKQGLSRIRVRAEPTMQAGIIGHIVPGEEVQVMEGPACANDSVWWRIRSVKTDLTGWSMEGDAQEAWLLPLP